MSQELLSRELIEKYKQMLHIAEFNIPKYKWIFVGMSINPKEHEICVKQHIKHLKKRNRSEESTISHDYMRQLYAQYIDFINYLNDTCKWILDYRHNEEEVYLKTLGILYLKEYEA